MSGWVFLVAALATGILLARARTARAARRRRAYERGEFVTIPVRLAPGPRPAAFAPGWVATDAGGPVWRPRRTGMTPVPLAGARVLRTDAPAGMFGSGEFVVTAVLPDGTRVRLSTRYPSLDLLEAVLGGVRPEGGASGVDLTKHPVPGGAPPYAPPPPPGRARPPAPVPWWSAALLGLATGWALIWAYVWLAGEVVDATVVGEPGGATCTVEWSDPAGGERLRSEVGCGGDETPGRSIQVLAMPEPMHGTATDLRTARLFPVLLTGSALLVGGAGIAARRRARRPTAAAVDPGCAVTGGFPAARQGRSATPPDVPRLGEDEVVWSRIAEVMAARAALEGWGGGAPPPPAEEEAPRRWTDVPALRRSARRSALRLVIPLVIGAVAVGSGVGSWVTTARLATGDARIAEGVVTRTADDALLPFLPERARIRYRTEERPRETWVPVTRKLTRGQEVSVLYSTADPGRARLDGDGDGLPRQATVTGLLAGLAAALTVSRVVRTQGDLRGLARARRGPARPWRFVRFTDHTGRPGVMLFSRFTDAAPVAVLPLLPDADMPAGLPVSGEAPVHGDVVGGGLAVPVIEGRTWWPSGRAAALPPAVVRNLVNGTLPDPLLARLTAAGREGRR